MSKNWDKLSSVGNGAALTESTPETGKKTRAKLLPNMPTVNFDDHKELKAAGKTSLNFSSYIYEAVREKLERDKAC